jgi:hypothetical protein
MLLPLFCHFHHIVLWILSVIIILGPLNEQSHQCKLAKHDHTQSLYFTLEVLLSLQMWKRIFYFEKTFQTEANVCKASSEFSRFVSLTVQSFNMCLIGSSLYVLSCVCVCVCVWLFLFVCPSVFLSKNCDLWSKHYLSLYVPLLILSLSSEMLSWIFADFKLY